MPQELLPFPPAYIVVGIYRLLSDPHLYTPLWAKCKHGARRGILIGVIWCGVTWPVQRAYVEWFMNKSPGLSPASFLGYQLPFQIPVSFYSTLLLLSPQFDSILKFFLSKNLRIARARAWDQTIASRGKPSEFWGRYAEEWKEPPEPPSTAFRWDALLSNRLTSLLIKQAILLPLAFIPLLGLLLSAALRALSTARTLHAPYFTAKNMNPREVGVFMEEHKWDYRAFGFAAALAESLPFIGVLLSISNRVGAAMWAFDLEKRQERFRKGELEPIDRPKPDNILPLPPAASEPIEKQDVLPSGSRLPVTGSKTEVNVPDADAPAVTWGVDSSHPDVAWGVDSRHEDDQFGDGEEMAGAWD